MPLRFTIYYLEYLKQWLREQGINLYGPKRIMIPTPHFVVFYNGTDNRPDYEVMKLSTSFCSSESEGEEAIEVRCKVYNINYGRNSWLAESSKVIGGYGSFVNKIRNYKSEGLELEDAIDNAIDDCIKEDVLKGVPENSETGTLIDVLTAIRSNKDCSYYSGRDNRRRNEK